MARTVEVRLLARAVVRPDTGCWEWSGGRKRGYGVVTVAGKRWIVSRLAAVVWLGFDDDPARSVCHHCDNPACFNPAHLYVGSPRTNHDDMVRRGRDRFYTTTRLTPAQVRAVRIDARQHRSLRGVARRFGVSHETIRSILQGRTYRHVT